MTFNFKILDYKKFFDILVFIEKISNLINF